ncbi:MAG: IPT/TIG domain-containing protein [Candidatus Symbiothrix sp.]|nr:IPT/TIG domain-containing protein [Candidatus Symbiothrix sp.]
MKQFIRLCIFCIALFGAMGNAFAQTALPPIITKPPVATSIHARSAALMLYVQALPRDEGALTYRWYSTTTPLTPSPDDDTLVGTSFTLNTTTPNAAGTYYYYCVVTNTNGTATSSVETGITTVTVINKSLYPQLMNGGFQEYYDFDGKTAGGVDMTYTSLTQASAFALPPVAATVDNADNATYQRGLKYWNTTHAYKNNNSYDDGKAAQIMICQSLGSSSTYLDTEWTNQYGELIKHNAYYDPDHLGPSAGSTIYRDRYFVSELCADQGSSLYQEVATVPGKIYEWSICHAPRGTTATGGDIVSVVIGTAINEQSDYSTGVTMQWGKGNQTTNGTGNATNINGSYTIGTTNTQYKNFTRQCDYPYGGGNSNSYFVDIVGKAGLGTLNYNNLSPKDGQSFVANHNNHSYYVFISSAMKYTTIPAGGKLAWKYQSGSYSVPEGQGITVFSFVGLVPGGASGNVLDNIVFKSGNNPVSASAMFYSGRVSLSAKTIPGYVYGIVEVRGSSVSLLSNSGVTWCDGLNCTEGNSISPYSAAGTDFADATVSNWFYPIEQVADTGNITFNNLTPSKTYRIVGIPVGAVSKESALNTNRNPSLVLDNGYYTEITIPAAWTGNDTQMATATATAESCDLAHIYLTNTDPNVEYALLDPMGDSNAANDTVVTAWQHGLGLATGAALIFEGLKTNYNYLVVARPTGYSEISYAIATEKSGVLVRTPMGCGGNVNDIQRSQVTRERKADGTDKIILTGIDSHGEYGIYNPSNGEFLYGGLFKGETVTGGTYIFDDLDANSIFHLAVRDTTTGSVFMVGVRVYPFAEELDINYVKEWVRQASPDADADDFIPKTTAYRLRANDTAKTWLIGNGNDIDHEDADTWVSSTGTSQLYLGLKRGAEASILDSTQILQATADTLHYRVQPVEKDGWVGPSISPELEPLIIPVRRAAPVANACGGSGGAYTIDYTQLPERITVDESKSGTIEYSLNNGENYTLIAVNPEGEDSVHLSTLGWVATPLTIPLRFNASQAGKYFASEPVLQPLAGRGPAPTEAMAVIIDESTEIQGLLSTFKYQYRESGVGDWINVADEATEVTGLDIAVNDYEIRYAPTCETPASLSQVLSIPLSIISINFGNIIYGYDADTIQSPIIIRNVSTEEVPFDGDSDHLYLIGDDIEEFVINRPGNTSSSVPAMDGTTMGENRTDYSISPIQGLAIGYYKDTIRLDYGGGNIAIAEVIINIIKATWKNNLTAEYFNPDSTSFMVNITPVSPETIPTGAIIEYSINPTFDRKGTVNLPIENFTFEDITAAIEVPNDLLEPASEYTVYYRYQADDKHFASETKTLTAYTAYALDCDNPVVEIDYVNEKLNMKTGFLPDNYDIIVNGVKVSMPYQVSAEAENPTFTVKVVRVGPFSYIPPSDTCTITVIGRENAPAAAAITINGTNKTIALNENPVLDEDFQYRVAGNTNIMANWQDALNITGALQFGGYELRRPATTAKFASKFITVTLLSLLNPTSKHHLYVDIAREDGISNTPNGSTWKDATPSLAHALEYARTNPTLVDSIFVAVGTYKPENITADDRDKTFTLPSNVIITGGYETTVVGNAVATAQIHKPDASSVLSGDFGSVNAYHVVTANGVTNVTLNGFVITGGNASGAGNNGIGGGLYNVNSSLKLMNVVIHSNTAAISGGGIYLASGTDSLINVTISGNNAVNGGGIYQAGGTLNITNSIIYGNIAGTNPEIAEIGGTRIYKNTMITTDPLFVDAPAKNFRLSSESPARNAGDDALYQAARNNGAFFNWDNETDVLGKKRKRDIIDMGAYESIAILTPSKPTIPPVICSGDSLELEINPTGILGIYSSSKADSTIAIVGANGKLYSDVHIANGELVARPAGDPDEGKGGTVTITFTADDDGNSATKAVVVTPRIQTPTFRWVYDGICTFDQSHGIDDHDEIYVWYDTIAKVQITDLVNVNVKPNDDCVPDSTNHDPNYFANYVHWDYIPFNGVDENSADFYDPDASPSPFANIRWYEDNEGVPGAFIRKGGDPAVGNTLENFWQNETHSPETYWASIVDGVNCESRKIKVQVNILATPDQLAVDSLIGYVQPTGTSNMALTAKYLDVHTDNTLRLEWYATKADAQHVYDGALSWVEADAIDSTYHTMSLTDTIYIGVTQPTDITYWVMRADVSGCRSLPTPYRIQLFPKPAITIDAIDMVCPGSEVITTVTISGGTAPYNFTIKSRNSALIKEETNYPGATYTFSTYPFNSTAYRITAFSDSITPWITDPDLGLHVPTPPGYFDETDIDIIVTEITSISPAFGPTTGGTFTTDSESPINTSGTITITGRGFAPLGASLIESVLFDKTAATIVEVTNNTITCIPPPHAKGNVTVSVAACVTIQLTDGYRYEPVHIIDIEPAYAPVTGGTPVTIRGVGLWDGISNPDNVWITLAGVPAIITNTAVTVKEDEIQVITGPSNYSLLDTVEIFNGTDIRKFADRFTYYPVTFIKDGVWSKAYNWETQTDDRILPYPGARIQIKANIEQDIDLTSDNVADYPNVKMDSITVHPNKAYTLGSGNTLAANVFTLKDDASFLNYGTMNATEQNVEHLLTQGRNWYISSPVQDATASNVPSDRIEWYDETVPVWKALNSPFVTGLGYTAYSDTDIAVKFSGTYTDGDQDLPTLTRTSGNTKEGYNLVGNPFPSYWHWTSEAATDANLYSTIWYRTHRAGIYEFWSYNASGDVAVAPGGWEDDTPSGSYSLAYVPPMQAFWVRVKDETPGTLTFANNQRAHADHNSNILRSGGRDVARHVSTEETRPMLRLRICRDVARNVSTGDTDETLIYADEAAFNRFDDYDSDKWFTNQGVEIFTLPVSENRALAINGLSSITDGLEIPIGFQADEGGAFSFRAKEILNLDTHNVFLRDKWLNEDFNLRSNNNYSFTSGSTQNTERFSIVFRSTGTDIHPVTDDRIWAYTDRSGHIMVALYDKNWKGSEAHISVFDIAGRKLTGQPITIGERTTLDGTFAEGVYLLRAGKWSAKVIVNL